MGKKGKKRGPGRPRKKVEVEEEYYSLSSEIKKGIVIIILFALAVISIFSFFNMASMAGVYINFALATVFGLTKYLFPIILLGLAYSLLRPRKYQPNWVNYIGIGIFILGLNGLIHLIFVSQYTDLSVEYALQGFGGGVVGLALSYPLSLFLGFWAALVILVAITLISIMLMFNTSLESILKKLNFKKITRFISNPLARNEDDYDDDDDDEEEEEEDEYEDEENDEEEDDDEEEEEPIKKDRKSVFGKEKNSNREKETKSAADKYADSKFNKVKINLPISLLSAKSTKPRSGDIDLATERIETTLSNFGIDIEMDDVNVGPTVTQYSFKPADGIKLSKITSLNNDLALALAAHPIRIEAPIPGKSLVGIEVPNHSPAIVPLRTVIESESFKKVKSNLPVSLGKDVSGECWAANLASMPHLLVAGATGSGKSVCLNAIILSLLYQNNPDTLRLILVDPKRVEFTVYNAIPHLLTPVITDVTKTVNALRWAIHEMDERFDILSKAGKRNIGSYNEEAENKMPYIVIIIDELADLMTSASAEVEGCIIKLTQMARAIGIHLVVATQRPSVDIITGLIKANIPARIAFSVASSMDSRTILDSVGAEKLIGKGDMLLQTSDMSKPRRLQGCFVSDNEIKRVVKFLRQAGGDPEYDDSVVEKQKGKSSFDFSSGDNDDDLFGDAKDVVVQAGKASASLLQRRLRVGYARAARLIDLLEERGIVGPADGARPRDILISATDFEDALTTPTVFKNGSSTAPEVDLEEEEEEEEDDDEEDEVVETTVDSESEEEQEEEDDDDDDDEELSK